MLGNRWIRTTTDNSSPTVSYALGPLHTSQVTEQACQLSNGPKYTLLIPQGLPSLVLDNPKFLDDCEFGYTACGDHLPSPMALANWMYSLMHDDLSYQKAERVQHPRPYAFTVAFLIGWLSALAETDHTLALVGMAHLLFLLSYLPDTGSLPVLQRELGHASYGQKQALLAYRTRVRDLRAQGVDLPTAYQLAYALPLGCYTLFLSAEALAFPQLS